MTGSIPHRLFQRIILLYPEPFRREFGEEMLSVFEECRPRQRSLYLLADGLAAALKQQLHYLATPAPPRTPLYSEVALSPRLARGLSTAVVGAAILLGVLVRDERPRARSWATIRIEHRILYVQCSNVADSARLRSRLRFRQRSDVH